MNYLKTYKLFESVETYQELFEMYRDCFIDLIDMNIFVGINLFGQLKDIDKESNDERNDVRIPRIDLSSDSPLTIEIVGRYGRPDKVNSSEHLTKVYNDYIIPKLEEDEYQFEKVSGYKIHNGLIKISIREWDVNPTTERWKELANNKNIQGYDSDRGGGVQYTGGGGGGYAYYTYIVNSNRLKSVNSLLDDRGFIKRLFSKKKSGYQFPKLTDKMEVQNFQIIHYISR